MIALILVFGFLITLVSGLYEQDFSRPGRDLVGHGLPLNWYRRGQSVIYPLPPESHVCFLENFALDLAFWSLIVAVLVVAVFKLLKKPVL
jgi:hypothetical protein